RCPERKAWTTCCTRECSRSRSSPVSGASASTTSTTAAWLWDCSCGVRWPAPDVRPGTGPALPAREHSPAGGGTVADTKRVKELYDLIEGIEIAMFTTRRPYGRLVSRPMATQERRSV